MAKETEEQNQDDADVILVKEVFATSDEKLSQMTRLASNQPLPLSMVVMIEQATKAIADRVENDGKPQKGKKRKLLSETMRIELYKHRRSLNADLLNWGVMVTQDQIAAKMEEPDSVFKEPIKDMG